MPERARAARYWHRSRRPTRGPRRAVRLHADVTAGVAISALRACMITDPGDVGTHRTCRGCGPAVSQRRVGELVSLSCRILRSLFQVANEGNCTDMGGSIREDR